MSNQELVSENIFTINIFNKRALIMKRSILKDFPFLILLALSIIMAASNILYKEHSLLDRHYIGIGSSLLVLIAYLFSYRVYKYLFTIVLILGSLSVIYFTNPLYTISFSFNFLGNHGFNTLSFQTVIVLLLVVQIVVNLKDYIRKGGEFFE